MFSQAPFAMGTVTGWRSFLVDPDMGGLLMGPMYPQIFIPGENKAYCLNHRDDNPINYYDEGHRKYLLQWNAEIASLGEPVSIPKAVAEYRDEHVGRIGCSCGFYCYWDDLDGVYQNNPSCVNAIVEGWGRVTYGPRGFRCSKMKVVGLVKPPHLDVPETFREKMQRRVKDRKWKVPKRTHTPGGTALFPSSVWTPVVDRYPDAVIFDTLDEARTAFPPTNPFAVEP